MALQPIEPTHYAQPLRLTTTHLTRVHLALNHRPLLRAAAEALTSSVCAELSTELELRFACDASLLPSAVRPVDSLAQPSGFALLELSATSEAAVLELELPFLAALLGRLAGLPAQWTPVSRLTRIEEATFGYLCLLVLERVRRHGGFWSSLGPRLVGVTLQRREALAGLDGRQRHLAFGLGFSVDGLEGTGRLLVPSRALRSVLHTQSEPPSQQQLAPSVAASTVSLRCVLAGGELSHSELRRLTVGDVIRLPSASRNTDGLAGALRLFTDAFELDAVLGPEGLRIIGASLRPNKGADQMAQDTQGVVNDSTELMPALPVDVEVELTRLRMTLSQLAQVRPGHVLPLRIDPGEPVVLRVGDRAIARAELVDIEGELGARILSLLG